jgi:hypothetical protein
VSQRDVLAPGRGNFTYKIEMTGRLGYLAENGLSASKKLSKLGAIVNRSNQAIDTMKDVVISRPGETDVPPDLLSGWAVAGLEAAVRSRFEKESSQWTGANGSWDLADLDFLQHVINEILAEMEGDGEIDEEQRKELRLSCDIQRLRHEAEGGGRNRDSQQSLRNSGDPFAGSGFCDASNTCH